MYMCYPLEIAFFHSLSNILPILAQSEIPKHRRQPFKTVKIINLNIKTFLIL